MSANSYRINALLSLISTTFIYIAGADDGANESGGAALSLTSQCN
jgi:hypothetical protein